MIKKTASIIFIIILICSCSKDDNNNKNKNFKVSAIRVKNETIKESIYSIGTISYIEKVNITSKIMGKVNKVYVDIGSKVYKGQILIQIEKFPLILELKKSQAEMESAKAALQLVKERYKNAAKRIEQQLKVIDKANADLKDKKVSLENIERITERKKKLLDIGAITQEEYENLQTELISYQTKHELSKKELEIQLNGYQNQDIINNGYKVPKDPKKKIKILKDINTSVEKAEVNVQKAKVKNARAQVDSIKLLLRKSTIRSPIKGIVAIRDIEVGERVVNEEPILVVMNIDYVYALLNIPESKINNVRKKDKIEIKADALSDELFKGYVHLISPIIDLKTRTVEIKGKLKNPSHKLKPGMFIRANIFTGKSKESITIPASCIITSQSNIGNVYTIHNKNEIYSKKIEFIESSDNKIEVLKGLKKNDLVVIDNLEKLNDGDKVNVKIKN